MVTTGGDNTSSRPQQEHCSGVCLDSPAAAARTFFDAAAVTDLATLRAATAPGDRSELASTANPDVGQLRCARPAHLPDGAIDPNACSRGALTSLTVKSAAVGNADLPIGLDQPSVDKWARVVVAFNALYRSQASGPDGPQARELLIGRDQRSHEWHIFSAVPTSSTRHWLMTLDEAAAPPRSRRLIRMQPCLRCRSRCRSMPKRIEGSTRSSGLSHRVTPSPMSATPDLASPARS